MWRKDISFKKCQKPERKHSHENIISPADKEGEQTRPEIPGRVDGVATVGAHRDADNQHYWSHEGRLETVGDINVPLVPERQDAQQQCSCADHLRHRWRKKTQQADMKWLKWQFCFCSEKGFCLTISFFCLININGSNSSLLLYCSSTVVVCCCTVHTGLVINIC